MSEENGPEEVCREQVKEGRREERGRKREERRGEGKFLSPRTSSKILVTSVRGFAKTCLFYSHLFRIIVKIQCLSIISSLLFFTKHVCH